jgi:predicted metalloprotease with PDZ domain
MLYADLLPRRAGAPLVDSSRVAHVERLLARYLGSAGSTTIPPERASLAEYAGRPGTLGDVDPSVHDQGEAIGTMLDLVIRDATADRRSIDDLMRVMMQRYSADSGFTTASVERAAGEVCGCVTGPFFDRWVRRAGPIDVDRYLRLIGYRARVTRVTAQDDSGRPRPDLRIFAWQPQPEALPSLLLIEPSGIWARAGLHTNDSAVSVNGAATRDARAFRRAIGALRYGDTARVAVLRAGRRVIATVPIAGYEDLRVSLEELPGATPAQLARLARWAAGR